MHSCVPGFVHPKAKQVKHIIPKRITIVMEGGKTKQQREAVRKVSPMRLPTSNTRRKSKRDSTFAGEGKGLFEVVEAGDGLLGRALSE